jgi:hypothetical protein
LLDEITFSETITFTYAEIVLDTLSSSEILSLNYSISKSELVTTTDNLSYSIAVPFNNDEVSSSETVTKTTSIVIPNENITNTDSIVINTNIQASDTQSLQDVGGEYFIESYFEGHENSLSPYVVSRYVGSISNF